MKVGLQLPYFNWPGSPANIGAKLTEMTKKQADYISVPQAGPYKPDHYRY